MEAKGRFFFEGMMLGNKAPITWHQTNPRTSKGFTVPSPAIQSHPVIGAYGYGKTVTITGQHIADDGDWIRFADEMHRTESYMQSATKTIEDKFVVRHDVANRALGTLGYALDNTERATVTSYAVGTDGFGSVQLNFIDPAPAWDIQSVVGDRIVLTDGVDGKIATFGEIAEITSIVTGGSANVTFLSRLVSLDGTTPYDNIVSGEVEILFLEYWWENCVFNEMQWQQPRSLADAGGPAQGIRFSFRSFGAQRRRSGVLPLEFVPGGAPMGNTVLGSDGTLQYFPAPDEFPKIFTPS